MSTSTPAEPVIHLRELRKSFGERRALDGIDLDLASGEIVGIVGPDGAGKTTLIRSLAGLLEVEAKEARVLGYDLRQDVTELKRHTGYVPQTFSLHRDLSVIENLRFTARLNRLPPEVFEARAKELLERTMLTPFANRVAGALSGGMKQKLAVSNALLAQPPLLLLDEPTAGVDVVARGEIWQLLERERSKALVLISTSYLDEAAACDRLIYLDEGRVIASGTPAELRARVGLELYRLWSADSRTLAKRARKLPYVSETRAGAQFVRVEVPEASSPGEAKALDDLDALPGTQLAEHVPVDMEATLLALARDHGTTAGDPSFQVQGSRSQVEATKRDPRPEPSAEHDRKASSSPNLEPGTANLERAAKRPSSPTSIITATGLTKKFGDFTAVDALDIHVSPGTIFAFLGANGSGKSTTIRMLIGLLEPTAGTIEVDGIDVIKHPRRVRDHIGYMGQKVSLYQGLSLQENADFYAGLYGLSDEQLVKNWGALCERFSLTEVQDEKSEDLPAGIRQRAGLALSTLHHPRVLFLDEPTAGVDVHNRNLFWELIQDEARTGVTVFVTTHFLEEVDYCDWVSFIDQGRLIADAEPETLRRENSDGYRIELELPAGEVEKERGALSRFGIKVEDAPKGLRLTTPGLDGRLLGELRRLSGAVTGARVRIEQPEMTDVFSRVLRGSATAKSKVAPVAA